MSSARKKLKKQKGNQMLFSPTGTLAFDEEKIVEITDRIEIKTPYSTIEKVYVADTAFYFYIGPIQAHILPYHNFDGEDQRNAFLSWLKTALGESKIVLVKK